MYMNFRLLMEVGMVIKVNVVQDPKGYATAHHKHSQYFFLLLIMVR